MTEVDDSLVQLVVTSPPYNVAKDYGMYNDKKVKEEYLELLNRVWIECKRKLCKGGRIAVNIADTWRQPYIPLHVDITQQLLDLGLLMRGLIYWDKGASVGVSTAWGSFRMASNPTLRDVGEHIIIFCKDDYQLESKNSISTITPEQFTAYTQSVWKFSTADPKKEGHPAPFPDELPKRLIQLYTFLGDTVLDPFLGSGTTCKVAKAWGRQSIGYELDEGYKSVIEEKISSVKDLSIPLDSFTRNGNGKHYLDDYPPNAEELDEIRV
jgi:site-specific DNA-methyltransferase (adenine-specific)